MIKNLAIRLISFTLIGGCAGTQFPKPTPLKVEASPSPVFTTSYDVPHSHMTVNVKINGQGPFPFVLDTGASGANISAELVETLNIPITGTGMAYSPTGGDGIEVNNVSLTDINLGGAIGSDLEATVMDFVLPGTYGVIGPSIFESYERFSIDFDTRAIEIGGALKNASSAAWIPFGESAPLLDLTLTIGDAQIPAHIDSGMPAAMALPVKFKDQLPLTGPTTFKGKARMIDREFDIVSAPMTETIQISDAKITLESVDLIDVPYANIGLKALKNLTLEIDWAHNRFALSGENLVQP